MKERWALNVKGDEGVDDEIGEEMDSGIDGVIVAGEGMDGLIGEDGEDARAFADGATLPAFDSR
jgi:hypothetical protein